LFLQKERTLERLKRRERNVVWEMMDTIVDLLNGVFGFAGR